MTTLPTTQKAVLSSAKARKLVDIPVPTCESNEILIKNVAVASNPKDWKVPVWSGPDYNYVEGNDCAGVVVAVGDKVTKWNVGDRVAGFSRMRTLNNRAGVYCEYTVVPDWVVFRIPDNISFEQASTLPLAILTSAISLGTGLGLCLSTPMKPAVHESDKKTVVINGASASTGSFAVQLAKLSNLRVIGIAGKGGDYVKSLGADVVIDYRGKSEDELIKEVQSYGPFNHAYDCVSSKETLTMLIKSLNPFGGQVVTILWGMMGKDELNALLGNRVVHKVVRVGVAHDEEWEFARDCMDYFSKALQEKKLLPNNVHLMPKGLESVDEGLELLKNNKVSAEKIVYRVQDTPSLKK